MSNSNEKIRQRAVVKEKVKGNKFVVALQDNPDHLVTCTLSGKMLKRRITPTLDDEVSIEISPYDLGRGRVVWRHNKGE